MAYSKKIFCLVMLFIANEENKKKICKPNRVYVHTDTFFTFQSSPLEIQKKKGGGKTEERWISPFGADEKIIETYWHQYHTE